MSHFRALVITDEPSIAPIEKLLAPYEESDANPNSKWDWWQLGGRYTGQLVSKASGVVGEPGLMTEPASPGTCDQCRVGDLDLDATKALRVSMRKEEWDEAQGKDEIVRQIAYGIKPGMTEAEYLDVQALSAFAIVDDSGWYEKGTMGWFATVANEKADWPQIFSAYIENLISAYPDKYVAMVDCHI